MVNVMNRRKFIKVTGGGLVAAAAIGVTGFFSTRTPTKALQPWLDAGSAYTEPRRKALSYAILAPNPHNRQPWLVDLSQPNQIMLHVDTERLLPHTDPFSRQIMIGLGCFLELLRMAAAADGYRIDIRHFPDGVGRHRLDARAIAVVTFARDATASPDPLFRHVGTRRTLKVPYDPDRPVSDAALASLRAASVSGIDIETSTDITSIQTLRTLTHEAMAIEFETPRTYKESVDLFRIGKSEIEALPDGIDLSGPLFEAMHAAGLLTREAALDRDSTAYGEGLRYVFQNTDTAMGYLWMTTKTNSRIDQIIAGGDWLRINLAATAIGLGIQPFSQALQEYPEMQTYYDRVHKLLAPKGGTIQMLGRLGYGTPVEPSPRWPLSAKIMKG